LQKIGEYTRW